MSETTKYLQLGDDNFETEVLGSSQPVLVDFWAPWCGPCLAMAPAIEELAIDFEGVAKVGKVNVDESPGLATTYGIQSIPTLMIFRDGKLVDQIVGLVQKRALAEKITAQLATA